MGVETDFFFFEGFEQGSERSFVGVLKICSAFRCGDRIPFGETVGEVVLWARC